MTSDSDKQIKNDTREPKRITPFSLRIDIQGEPDLHSGGYRLITSGYAELDNRRFTVFVRPGLEFFSAQLFKSLEFRVYVNAEVLVPLLHKANNE